ncbi:MAG: hypothetical protein P1U89_26860, partial [Verrucomicrobiales bacterium]|nr:hypothetical protein [Verrucomicrobiales bacterium]
LLTTHFLTINRCEMFDPVHYRAVQGTTFRSAKGAIQTVEPCGPVRGGKWAVSPPHNYIN